MMRVVEIWLAISTTARDTLEPLLDDPDYDGQHLTAVRILRQMIQRSTVQRMFRTGTFGGKQWVLYSVHLDISANPQRAKQAVDYLATNYPGNLQVIGAWHWDGRPVGTQWQLDQDGNRVQENIGTEEEPIWQDALTGTPEYPTPTTALLKLMPTIKQYDQDGNLVSETEPTELGQVHLIQGQSPRRYL